MNARRRTVLLGSLAAGLARPAVADEERVEIAVGDAAMPAARVRPEGAARAAVVVVGDEAGIGGWAGETAKRLAASGYVAVAPDVWADKPGDALALRRIAAALAWAGQEHGGRAALTGLGEGGRLAWLAAAGPNPPKAAIAWGGAVDGAASEARPRSPTDVAAALGAPVLGLFGKADPANTRARLLHLESVANGAKRTVSIIVYVGAAADFARAPTDMADRAAATDGWDRMLAWLDRYDR